MDRATQVQKVIPSSRMEIVMKYLWLMIVRFTHRVLNKLPSILSYFFLAFSVMACLIILVPSCFDRVPVLSYYISEHELPMVHELHGEVKVLDEKGNIVNKNVEVFVGGYSTSLTSTEFNLKFSAPTMNEVFVVIRYEVDGDIREFTKCVVVKGGNHVIKEEFIIHA